MSTTQNLFEQAQLARVGRNSLRIAPYEYVFPSAEYDALFRPTKHCAV